MAATLAGGTCNLLDDLWTPGSDAAVREDLRVLQRVAGAWTPLLRRWEHITVHACASSR